MTLNHNVCFQAIQKKDHSFDGIFYVGDKKTGVFCRPICKGLKSHYDHLVFLKSEFESLSKGYRPCLICRPELAPDYMDLYEDSSLIKSILYYFKEDDYRPGIIRECQKALNISSQALEDELNHYLGVNPQDYILSHRLLRAKILLSNSKIPIDDVAKISGFSSLSKLNNAFINIYKLAPPFLRKETSSEGPIVIKLGYRPPYDWKSMLDFYRKRLIPGVESLEGNIYRRSIWIQKLNLMSGWIEVEPLENEMCIRLTVSQSLEKGLLEVVRMVKEAFDLDASPELYKKDLPIGIRLPGCFDVFEMATRAILGQQITVKAARTLTSRFVEKLGRKATSPWSDIIYHFPTASTIANIKKPISDVLGPLGIIKSRSHSIQALAILISNGDLILMPGAIAELEKEKLLGVKGIGPWTAEYLSMRGMGWSDAFPVSDIGIRNALSPFLKDEEGHLILDNKQNLSKYKLNKLYEKSAQKYAQEYKPFRSYLTISLWNSLES